jgi:hypothetical protein
MLFQLTWPGSADAWWGWIDELSGPDGFHGVQVEARVKCFQGWNADSHERVNRLLDANSQIQTELERARPQCTSTSCRREFEHLTELIAAQSSAALDLPYTGISRDESASLFIRRARIELHNAVDALIQQLSTSEDLQPLAIVGRLQERLAEWQDVALRFGTAAQTVKPETTTGAGGKFSFCREEAEEARRWSVSIGARLFWLTDNSPEVDGDEEAYAGGHRMYLFTVIPAVEYRVHKAPSCLVEKSPCTSHLADYLDALDLGIGAGYYRVSSEGFHPLEGMVIEPRFTVRLPTWIVHRYGWTRIIPQVTVGGLGFVGGFKQNAFGPNLKGPKADRIDERIDWTCEKALFFDFGSIFR